MHLPDSLLTIGEYAFDRCHGLTSIIIPGNVTELGKGAFFEDISLKSISFKTAALAAISDDTFVGCRQLQSVVLPNGVQSIGQSAFFNCVGLQSVTLPASLRSIGRGAFAQCEALLSIVIPNGVTSIGNMAFYQCHSLERVTLPAGITMIGDETFECCLSLKAITIPEGVTRIGLFAFSTCPKLQSVSLPKSLKTLEGWAFSDCDSLKTVSIPSGVTKVGERAFAFEGALTDIYFLGPKPAWGPAVFDQARPDFRLRYHISVKASWSGFTDFGAAPFCKLTLNIVDGATVQTLYAPVSGGKISRPSDPVRAGYRLENWCRDPDRKNVWNFGKDTVTGDITLYAKWAPAPPAIPASVKAVSNAYNSIKITWAAVPFADGYEVSRCTTSNGTYTVLANLTTASCIDSSPATGKLYYYKVRAYRLAGTGKLYGSLCSAVSAKAIPGTPVAAAALVSYTKIKISWGSIAGATQYEVYRAAASAGPWSLIASTPSTDYTNTDLVTGKTYYYKVKVYHLEGTNKVYGLESAVIKARPVPSTPAVKAASASYSSIELSWGAVAGATGYEISRSTASAGPYAVLITTAATSHIDTDLATGTVYYYRVRAYHLEGTTKVYGSYGIANAKPVPAAPTGVTAARASATSIKVSWSAAAGATNYEVWRATVSGGAYSLAATTSSRNWTDIKLATGKTYWYKVKAYRLVGTAKVYGNYSAVVYAKP